MTDVKEMRALHDAAEAISAEAAPAAVESVDLTGSTDMDPEADLLAPYDAVLLLSYGGPTGPEAVLPFMRNATAGRGVPDSRLLEVSGHYQRFGGASPINERNAELLEALRAELARRGSRVPVVIGNRNWHPFVSQALRELADAGARRVLALTTAAYGSYSGCRQYREDLSAALGQLESGTDGATGQGPEADAAARVGGEGGRPLGAKVPVVDKTRPYYNTPGMLEANTEAITAAYRQLAGQGVAAQDIRLVFVTHSIPVPMEEGSAPGREVESRDPGSLDPGVSPDLSSEISYVAQHEALIEALLPRVAERLGLARPPEHELVYCSRSGPPQARWLEPDINDRLEALADQAPQGRVPGVVVAPIGFVSDHMEVVFDLDTEARETADALGMPYARAATAGTHPAFVASLVDVLAERAATARGEAVRPTSTTGLGPFHTVCPPECCLPSSGRGQDPGHGRGDSCDS